MVIVCKFGGTSAKDGPTLEHVIENIILANPDRRVNVFSAPGKRDKGDVKITDLLITIGEDYYNKKDYRPELVEKVKDRFSSIAAYFSIPSNAIKEQLEFLERVVRTSAGISKEEYLDSIKPLGEIINAELVAYALKQKGVDAVVFRPEEVGMITDGNFGKAKIMDYAYTEIRRKLKPVLNAGKMIIFPGFYGVDKKNKYTTFPRGGSDLTGAILANALDAAAYENWTDRDGIGRADPRIVENADYIKRMTYKEAREMAYSGAEILHPDTLIPLISKNIPLHVRNTFNHTKEGTYIGHTKIQNGNVVEGIAHKEGFTVLYIEKTGMNEEVGYLSNLLKIFADGNMSIDQMTTSIDSVSIAVPPSSNEKINIAVENIQKAGLSDSVNVKYDEAMVCVVGEGMRTSPGVLGELISTLSSAGVNVDAVYQGPSERSVIFGLKQKDAVRAVKTIYGMYFGKL